MRNRLTVATLLLPALLGSCAVAPPAPPLAPGAMRCIDLNQVAGRRGSGGEALDFEMTGGLVYRNHLQGRCPGLARLGETVALAIVSGGEGGRLCSGDRVRVFDPVEARAVGINAQPSCVLGAFTPLPRS